MRWMENFWRRCESLPEGAGAFSNLFLRLQYVLIVGLFNVFPLPQRSGFRKSFAFAGELADRGYSVLVFPEGVRTKTGTMAPFRAGIGLLATRLRLPVVPVRFDGLFERKQAGGKWAPPGFVRVAIGAPVRFSGRPRATAFPNSVIISFLSVHSCVIVVPRPHGPTPLAFRPCWGECWGRPPVFRSDFPDGRSR